MKITSVQFFLAMPTILQKESNEMQETINRNNDEIEIDLVQLFGELLRHAWIIILCAVFAGLLCFVTAKFIIPPKYESSTGIYIMSNQGTTISYSDTQLATQLTKDYEALITCRTVLEAVISTCGLNEKYEDLKDRITVANKQDTRILYITVKDTSPAMAQTVANSVREIASAHIQNVTDVEAVKVVDEANLPEKKCEPSCTIWTAVGILIGAFLSIAIIFIRFLMDDTIKNADDVEKYLSLSTLAMIPLIDGAKENKGKRNVKSASAAKKN